MDIAQGAENAGKALVVGSDGNIELSTSKTSVPLSYCNIHLSDYLTYTGSSSANLSTSSCLIRKVGNSEYYPSESYDCVFQAIKSESNLGSSNTASVLSFSAPSQPNDYIPMFNKIFDELNVDISNLPNNIYRIELIGCSGNRVVSNSFVFYLTISNGLITTITRDETGNISFAGNTNTQYCSIGIKAFYRKS